jgi:S-adenosylmethionine synthetase
MPATLHYSHKILQRMAEDRHSGAAPFLEPDAKSQVTLAYENEIPVRATALVVSTQHAPNYFYHDNEGDPALYKVLHDYVVGVMHDVLPRGFITPETKIYVNPTGRFEIGGPDGDAGVTGRKIIVDTYGGASPHGGGAFSGKDPTKVDRSAAYACRYLAKNVVGAGLARRCTIQISYAIGVSEPLSFYVDTHGTGSVPDSRLEMVLPALMRLTPKGIRTHLGLNAPIYRRTAAYGHFGREPDADGGFGWERLDLVSDLRAAV